MKAHLPAKGSEIGMAEPLCVSLMVLDTYGFHLTLAHLCPNLAGDGHSDCSMEPALGTKAPQCQCVHLL